MAPAQVNVAVIGHISRQTQAEALAAQIGARLFLDRLTLGSTWNHLSALNWGAQFDGNLIVLEDDAEPAPDFLAQAGAWIDRFPNRVISFYLGTDRRPHQKLVPAWLEDAERAGRDWIEHPKLLHAVAYIIPCELIRELTYRPSRFAADEMISEALRLVGAKPVLYTIPSFADHADGTSVENRPYKEPRSAWRT